MQNESCNTLTTSKILMYVQFAASIVPIFAHIALAIMAWLQHNWMMFAMIIPSIMMYVASLVPQILQYEMQKNSSQNNSQENQQTYYGLQNTNTFNNDTSCGKQQVENLPDILTPVSLETLLMTRNTVSTTQPPWKTILHEWLKNANAKYVSNAQNSVFENMNSFESLFVNNQKHLIAPLGISNNGYCYIDLIADGPHALVAGTTGSGKSVLLTTWCLALAAQYAPQQLRFVFMDFKGGATFDTLSSLPHVMGNVCDLNLRHATRALRGLELELSRRERLVAQQGCNNISQVMPAEPSLIIVIDEFHALKDQLPDYMPRLVRIAAVGRSLGMHIIAGTQNPLGQISADMKANIAINICLRVRDSMQSQELLGTSHAAHISPQAPGSAYYNIGEGVMCLRCAQCNNSKRLVSAIQLAGKFLYHEYSQTLFSAPLPSILLPKELKKYEYETNNIEQKIVIGLQDNSIRLFPAVLPIYLGNIAIIGGRQRGKSNILRVIAKNLQLPVYSGKKLTSQNLNLIKNENKILIIDDVDELLDPLNTEKQAIALQERLHNNCAPIIISTNTARYLRLPDQAPVRIIFPSGDIGNDSLLGIPSQLSKTFEVEDYQLPGRCVIATPGTANLAQIVKI